MYGWVNKAADIQQALGWVHPLRPSERRGTERFATRVFLTWSGGKAVDRHACRYLEGVAENVGLGGMFIATDKPASVRFRFRRSYSRNNAARLRVKGSVELTQRYSRSDDSGISPPPTGLVPKGCLIGRHRA